ncbi:MAG: hypothetical protein OXH39_15260 [Candidatus Poribacteria bacterium]|nr:hypothetical protein [Candidatus Poribacteria bacterium]
MSEQTDPSQLNNEPQKLRPMGFGDLLDAIFSLYRAHFLPFLAIASGYFIAILIVISIVFLDDSVGRGAKIAIWISTVSVIFGVFIVVVSGLVFASTEAYLSRNIRVGAALRQAMPRFLPCFIGSLLFGLLAFLCVLFANILFMLLIQSYISTVDDLRSINAFLLNFTIQFVFVTTIVCLAGFFLPYWSFFVSTVSLEGRSIRAGLRRSRELIRGRRWRVVGTVLAIFLLPLAIGFVLRAVFAFLLVLTGLEGMGGFLETVRWMSLWELPTNLEELRLSYALMYLINLGVDTFTIPIWVIGCTLLYFDQRIRKEGFDIEMIATSQEE